MSKQIRSFRTISLIAVLGVLLCLASLASAQNLSPERAAQSTPAATATIDPDAVVKLTIGQAIITPLDKDNIDHRKFSFSGKANDIMTITGKMMTGNFGFSIDINSQNGVTLSSVNGSFLQQSSLTVKLPQDGNYEIDLHIQDPGSGDSTPGTMSVWVTSGTPTMSATAAVK